MKILKLILITAALFAAQFSQAKQDIKSNVYQSGDNACMVGDSITAGGWYTANIMLYYATRFPEMKINFYNVGISGDSCGGILWRMKWDVLPHNPSVSVLMIGMNDVGRTKYGEKERAKLGEENFKKQVDSVAKNYEIRLSQVVDALASNSRRLIIFTPSIYDQTADLKTENLFGVNDGLVEFGKIGGKLAAQKNNAVTVDMSKKMLEVNAAYQTAEGKNKTIVGPDRVHPKFAGAFVMLNKWLEDLDEPAIVSDTEINFEKKSVEKSVNCDISNLEFTKKNAAFTSLEAALPFPVEANSRGILKYVDFQKKFNLETLKISGLPEGTYALSVDKTVVGKYSSKELSDGVNLAENIKTPQYKQAEQVYAKCLVFREKAASYRSIFMLELFNRNFMDKLDIDGKIAFIQKKLDASKDERDFMISAYKFYIANKKKQAAIFEELKKINGEIYAAAQPKAHNFEVVKIK